MIENVKLTLYITNVCNYIIIIFDFLLLLLFTMFLFILLFLHILLSNTYKITCYHQWLGFKIDVPCPSYNKCYKQWFGYNWEIPCNF